MKSIGKKLLVLNGISVITIFVLLYAFFVVLTYDKKPNFSQVDKVLQLYSDGLQYSNALRMVYIDKTDIIAQTNMKNACEDIIK